MTNLNLKMQLGELDTTTTSLLERLSSCFYLSVKGRDYPILYFDYSVLTCEGVNLTEQEPLATITFFSDSCPLHLKLLERKNRETSYEIIHKSMESLMLFKTIIEPYRLGTRLTPKVTKGNGDLVGFAAPGPTNLTAQIERAELKYCRVSFPHGGYYGEMTYTKGEITTKTCILGTEDQNRMIPTAKPSRRILQTGALIILGIQDAELRASLLPALSRAFELLGQPENTTIEESAS